METQIPTIYQCKWFNTVGKQYEDEFVSSLDKATKLMVKVFNQGSRYFSINIVEIK